MSHVTTPVSDPTATDSFAETAERLEQIVDDTAWRGECSAWVNEQFLAGRDADSLLAELLVNGWPQEDAESIVEQQRRATRHVRGCATRDEVAVVAEKRYRNAFHLAFRMAVGGLLLVGAHFLMSLISSQRIPWPDRMKKRRASALRPVSTQDAEPPPPPVFPA